MSSHDTAQPQPQPDTSTGRPKSLLVISILAAFAGIFLALVLGNTNTNTTTSTSNNHNDNSAANLFGLRRFWTHYSPQLGISASKAKPTPSSGITTTTTTTAGKNGINTPVADTMKSKTPVYFLSHGGVSPSIRILYTTTIWISSIC